MAQSKEMDLPYFTLIEEIERISRLFLELLKIEVDRLGIRDINNVQTMLLFNIGDQSITIGELTLRGYYIGTNVTYNLRQLIENGYLCQEKSVTDRRSSFVFATQKGKDLNDRIQAILARHQQKLEVFSNSTENLSALLTNLRQFERGMYRLNLSICRSVEDF